MKPIILLICYLLFAFKTKKIECAKSCYFCENCNNLQKANTVNCASYMYDLRKLPYDTPYSCEAKYQNRANVTTYTLDCKPTEECVSSTRYLDHDGTFKWSKCCNDNLCNIKLFNNLGIQFSANLGLIILMFSAIIFNYF